MDNKSFLNKYGIFLIAFILLAFLASIIWIASYESHKFSLQWTGNGHHWAQSLDDIQAVIQGQFIGDSPQLNKGYYTIFLSGVPVQFQTIYCPDNSNDIYDKCIFGASNTFVLQLIGNRWILLGVSNANGSFQSWQPF